ncbi:MAG: NAD-dependent epimerase/dehydratase family protein [bacterium]|jgi:UDP-glucose 4-epimerase
MTTPLLIVGGNSRAARSFRALVSQRGQGAKILAREKGPALAGETWITTADYFQPPVEAFDRGGVVVNFVGATSGPTEKGLMRLNAEGPIELAGRARSAGAAGFVQLSSLSIFGGAEDIDHGTIPAPKSAYGRSKLAAETGLLALSDKDFRIVLARAPMIYGPQGGGKLSQLLRLWSAVGVLPAPRRLEQRSMVHVQNLALAIHGAIEDGPTRVIFPCDPEPFDLAVLRDAIRAETGRGVRLQTMPSLFFDLLARAAPSVYDSLYARSLVARDSRAPLPSEAISLDMSLRDFVRAELVRIADA